MKHINFNAPVKVHFIGIGGISMSSLAEILLDRGFTVTGSDWNKSDLTERLESKGVIIAYGKDTMSIPSDTSVVIYSAAVSTNNKEYAYAVEENIPLLSRAELLGQLMDNYRDSIAVAGTHGKTSTTSMIAEILLAAGADPTITVGGKLNSIGGTTKIGQSERFVAEACEYTNSFLHFYPEIAIILNVTEDHLDFFKDIEDIRHSFRSFADNIKENGALIINNEVDNIDYFEKDLNRKVITYGINSTDCTYTATDITFNEYACGSYSLYVNGVKTEDISLSVTGLHNISNSLAAIAAARELSIDYDSIKKGLLNFTGTQRRFEKKGVVNGVTVIDDYAHHPDEIRATLTAAKNYPHNKIWCVFQPHTFSRTKSFLKDFASSLSLADNVILADIYPARETDTLGMHSTCILDEIKPLNPNAFYFPSFDEIERFLTDNCKEGDVIITMGAGDVIKIGENLVSNK